jgi:UDP-N-acetylmuramoyl-tripeptide--D-alanyl-D-alanine ligase
MRLRLDEVLAATAGSAQGGDPDTGFSSFHTDSREVEPGGLFFALRGAEMDGHRFVAAAAGRGAGGVVVDRFVNVEGPVQILVGDTWHAFYDLARAVLDRVAPVVIGITGSNGKTSTKEMAAAAMATRFRTARTMGNLNTETGVPLTILRIPPETEVLVLEMGLQLPGDVARLAALARPRFGVVTNVGSVHIEFFGSREELVRSKGELLAALPVDGVAVINADDPSCPLLRSLAAAPVVTFGIESGDLRGEDYRPLRAGGGSMRVRGIDVRIGLSGRHQALNAMAALAVAEAAGVTIAEAAPALASVTIPQRLHAVSAPGGFTVVDDSYNASPESMLAAFEAVAEMSRSGRLLAVLGEMRELGEIAETEHRRIGARAGEVFDSLSVLATGWGPTLATAAGAEVVDDREAAARWVRAHARPGDIVLVKASHGLALDELVKELVGR